MSNARAREPFILRGVHVLICMLVFFGAVIAVNIAFAVLAVRSFPGEDVPRSYLQGVQYNQTIAERRAQAASGWQAHTVLSEYSDGPRLEVRLNQRDGASVRGGEVSGVLQWPADARRDIALRFEPEGDGLFVARIPGLTPGRWRLRAHAQGQSGGALDFESELTWAKTPS
jgi:nitrogen fixation protein FixH